MLALSRQNLPTLRAEHGAENLSARGAYVLAEADGARATSRSSPPARRSTSRSPPRDRLAAEGIADGGRVDAVLGAVRAPGRRPTGRRPGHGAAARRRGGARPSAGTATSAASGDVIGMRGFGASAPAKDLFEHFGITAEAILARAREATALPRAA